MTEPTTSRRVRDLAGSRAGRDIARHYGPVLAVTLAFLLLATLVSPVDRATAVRSEEGAPVIRGGPTRTTDPNQPGDGEVGPGDDGQGGTPGQAGTPGAQGPTITADYYVPSGAAPCPDRAVQVPGDPYSPPCYVLAGADNGGATHTRGVTADEIVLSARELGGPSAAEIFAELSGAQINDSPEAVRETITALAEYFSDHFEMYGRTLRVEFFKGDGNGATELLGGGQETARSDALIAAKDIGAFIDISAITIPYAAAVAEKEVIGIGSPYPSRRWFVERAPYAWALFTDGTTVVESSAEWLVKRLKGRPAVYAGAPYTGRPRKYALIAPENKEYQESVNAFLDLMKTEDIAMKNFKYKLDLGSMANQASGIIAQLKNEEVTTVLCACDPVMLALGMAPKANEQDYDPEWVTAGLAFVDQDIVAQLIDEDQWVRAFGTAYNAAPEPFGATLGYNAYKSVRPNNEPAFGVDAIYYQLYLAVLGIQMAGPDLNPHTFQEGMFAYPGGQGPIGRWGFGPGDFTPTDDYREVWWDPDRISPQNNEPGAWVELNGGRRYLIGGGELYSGNAPYFE